MDYSAKSASGFAQIIPKELYNKSLLAKKNSNSRRTTSFSSSSSLSSLGSLYFLDDSPLTPATALHFSGVPFSWEHLPGIPKKKESILKQQQQQLPLPPTSSTLPSSKKYHFQEFGKRKKDSTESFKRDPFIAALVECSKDDGEEEEEEDHDQDQDRSSRNFFNGEKVSRSLSDRLGFVNLYTSCKKACTVSESIVYLPRSSRTSIDLIRRHSRGNLTLSSE